MLVFTQGTFRAGAWPAGTSDLCGSTTNAAGATSVTNSITQRDVIFGDVFVCSGQINMIETVSLVVNNASAEIAAAADFPWIRVAGVGKGATESPQRDLEAGLLMQWQRASPTAIGNGSTVGTNQFFSATCWFTARNLALTLRPAVPIGLVESSVGGTPIEA